MSFQELCENYIKKYDEYNTKKREYENNELELKKFKESYLEFCSNDLKFNKGKLILEVKNQVINELKEKAIEKINLLEKGEKLKFFEQILTKNAENNETLTYNINDFEDEDFNKIECVKSLNLKVKKDLSIEQGMILSTDIYDKNLSLQNIVNELLSKNQQEIYKVLF